jgi:acyl transferase domain-containing protein
MNRSDARQSIDSEPHEHQPLAIIGMGCRFPGAECPSEYWDLLSSGRTAIGDIPQDRWNADRFYDPDPGKQGTTYVRKGGFLRQPLDGFDAAFFGISPREAMCMDPQQRLLLEAARETLEDAGVVPPVAARARLPGTHRPDARGHTTRR